MLLLWQSQSQSPGFAVGSAEPSAAPEHQQATVGQILKEGSEQLIKPPVTDGECKLLGDCVKNKKQLAVRAQLLKGSLRH